jgi:YfiH family protein
MEKLSTVLYPFRLNFDGAGLFARFSFMFEGKPVTRLADGSAAPSCVLSGRAAGSMKFDPHSGAAGLHGPVRESLFRTLGVAPGRVYSLVQVHSRDVFTVPWGPAAPDPGAFARPGDGLVCFPGPAGGPVLAVTVADCLPVFLLDTRSGSFAALHSGWKGTGIVLKALSLMRERGTRPEETAAVLGPCIQSCCYQVDDERAALFEAEFGPASPHVRALIPGGGSYPLGPVVRHDHSGSYLGLQAANARLLAAAGVRHIACCEDCTFTGERLGSYRREGPSAYTRMAAMAGDFSI